MDVVFLKAVNISIAAGWFILVIILLRGVLKRAPRWFFCVLWGLVGLRLIFPFSLESRFSLIPSAETLPMDILLQNPPAVDSGVAVFDHVVNPVLSDALLPREEASVNPAQIVVWLASLLWVLGIVIMLCYLIISYLKLHKRIRTATFLCDNIWQSEFADSPFILGIVRPRIYIPYHLGKEQLSWVLAHEKAHLARKDYLIKFAAFLVLSIYWFHPLIWVAYILLCKDIELACDEKVIRNLAPEERKSYSLALLGNGGKSRLFTACPLAFGEIGIRERILHIKTYHKPVFWVSIAVVLLCILAGVCFLTNPGLHESMEWAKHMTADEVERIELVVMPQAYDKQYRLITDREEIRDIAELIKGSHGRYVEKPENLAGSSQMFYVNMKDGTMHTVGNIGNYYLVIDGDSYRAGYDWLSSWVNYYEGGNAALPADFFDGFHYVWGSAETLFAHRTKYIGDHIAVGNIFGNLSWPAAFAYQQYALQTSQEPYEVTITFAVPKEEQWKYASGGPEEKVLEENAYIMFALIENAGIVNLEMIGETGQAATLSFNREMAEKSMDCDLWAESGSVEQLADLLVRIEEKFE